MKHSGRYYIKTFGCQANKSDSERIEADYQARGYKPADSWKTADEIVVNTCSVRQRAEDRAQGFLVNIDSYFNKLNSLASPLSGKLAPIRRTGRATRKSNPKPKIILTGCMTHHSNRKVYEMLPMVDEILPVGEVGFNSRAIRRDKIHAWVPISSGCNSFCTFCIVPYARGREKSRPIKEIIEEVKKLAADGYREITLLGMSVNSWGLEDVSIGFRKLLMNKDRKFKRSDLPTNQSQYLKAKDTSPFVKLLQEISKIDGIEKIRFLTSNPWDFHDELIDEIAGNKKIDRFIHLPIQSGSNIILKKMNRGYRREDYISLVQKLRKKILNVVIGTDIIVGFPGETEEDFQKTVDLAKQLDWKIAFVAQYSPRPGTAAWRIYEDDIPPQEKKRRWKILDELINGKNLCQRPKVII